MAMAEASTTTTLEMAFDIAFNNEQKLEEYQKRIKARTQGKITRRTFTDIIKDYLISQNRYDGKDSGIMFAKLTNQVYLAMFVDVLPSLKEKGIIFD